MKETICPCRVYKTTTRKTRRKALARIPHKTQGLLVVSVPTTTTTTTTTTTATVRYYAQSNYCLTLGLAKEIGFWTPD
jgi:hypothetical protein